MTKYILLTIFACSFIISCSFAQGLHHFYPNIKAVKVYDSTGKEYKDPFGGGVMFPVLAGIDLNADYKTDIVLLDKIDNRILTFLNTGGGDTIEFTYQPEFEHLFPDTLQSFIMLKDFNGDKKPDLFTYSGSMGAGIAAYRNIGSNINDISFKLESAQLEAYFYGNYDYSFNLPMFTVDLPAIVDFDGDGDLDIFVFDPLGGAYLNLYNNFCMERYGNADSLLFSTIDEYYGYFFESDKSRHVTLNNVPPVWMGKYKNYKQDYSQYHGIAGGNNENEEVSMRDKRHAGSTVFANDMDADGDLDMLIGDIQNPGIAYLKNGKNDFSSQYDSMISIDYDFPSYDKPVNIHQMPATYYIDVDRDHIKDMIFAPVDIDFIDTFQTIDQVWLYRNKGHNTGPDLEFVQPDFLTSNMMYLGGATQPAFLDYDADGDDDLLVVTTGDFSKTFHKSDRIVVFENTGTPDTVVYRYAENDYLGFYDKHISELSVCFADYNNDGNKDMVTGSKDGKVVFYKNVADPGNPPVFQQDTIKIPKISEGSSYPVLADLNHDSLADLILGSFWGRLIFYTNTGLPGSPEFTLTSDTFGGFYLEGGNHYTSPAIADLDTNGHPDLVVGYQIWQKSAGMHLGKIAFFKDIDLNLQGKFISIDTLLYDSVNKSTITRSLGLRLKPGISCVDNDSLPDIMVGNMRGGLMFFGTLFDTSSKGIGIPEIVERNPDISVFPNPCTNMLNITIDNSNEKQLKIQLIDIYGREVKSMITPPSPYIQIPVHDLVPGVYLIRFIADKHEVCNSKFLKE